jgi:hypothetical protein
VPSVAAGFAASAQGRRLGWLLHAHLVETKLCELERAVKANFDPNQPRVPAGSPDGGQWTDAGGGGGAGGGLVRVAQNDPTGRLTDIPEERPTSAKLRNTVIKIVARHVSSLLLLNEELRGSVGRVLNLLEVASWVHEFVPYIAAYADPPRTLEDLQEAVSTPATGYDIHHIAEQTPAEQDGFPRSQIDSRENLVRIPTLKHWQITSWFARRNPEFGGRSPRDYLRNKDWNERMQIGRRALIDAGVLKP